MENSLEEKHRDKNGWAMDADPKNDPTYPIKKRTNEEHKGYTWERPTQQFVDIEVLHSNERPNVTTVFGTSTPPSGLSGMIRRYAFKFSENHYGHWLPLILADRINVVEGIVDDLKRGHIPNVFAERGWNAEWKYNRKAAVSKIAVGLALTALIVLKISKKSK